MSSTTVKVDEKGRIVLPKSVRESASLKEGSYVTIKTKGTTIIMQPAEPVADKYYGIFKVNKWPENMDEFITEVINKWWPPKAT